MWTPFLPVRLDYAFNWEGYEPKLKTIAPRASETYRYVDEVWEIAPPPPQRKKPYLKFGLDVPMRGKIKWVAPRAPQNWDLSLRERWIHRLYKLYVCQ